MLTSGARRRKLEEAEQVGVLPSSPPCAPVPGIQDRAAHTVPSPKVGTGLNTVEQQIRESRISLEKDIEALSELLARLGKGSPRLGPDP